MRLRSRFFIAAFVFVLCVVAHFRADEGGAVLPSVHHGGEIRPIVEAQRTCRFRVIDESGTAIPLCKVTWCAPGVLMSGGLSDREGILDVKAPRNLLTPVSFHLGGRSVSAFLPPPGKLGVLRATDDDRGVIVTGQIGDTGDAASATTVHFHSVASGDNDSVVPVVRGRLLTDTRGLFRVTGVQPGSILVLGATGEIRQWEGCEWQPTLRWEIKVPKDTTCCLNVGRRNFPMPTLKGRVVDAAGRPRCGVRVVYRPRGRYLSKVLSDRLQLPFAGEPPSSRTGEQGEFVFNVFDRQALGVVDLSWKAPNGERFSSRGFRVSCTLEPGNNKLVLSEPSENGP